ncbi:MAG: autoinducer binding domain-containing protein, partial [Janthinobacterium lividum]
MGFPTYYFGLMKHRNASFDHAFINTNYSRAWRQRYADEQMHRIDPIVSHCSQNLVPLVWKSRTERSEQHAAFYEWADECGMRSGVSFPMHGLSGEFGIISFVDVVPERVMDFATLSALALIRDHAFESALKFL